MWNREKALSSNSNTKFSKAKLSGPVVLTAILGLLFAYPAIETRAHDDGVDTHTSLQVHGDWVVTVANPDGSIAQERSFQNALVTPGLLVGMLYYASGWTDSFAGTIWTSGEEILPWFIEVATSGVETATCQTDLTVSYSQFGNEYEKTAATESAVSSSSFTLTRTLVLPLECVIGESYAINGLYCLWSRCRRGRHIRFQIHRKNLRHPHHRHSTRPGRNA